MKSSRSRDGDTVAPMPWTRTPWPVPRPGVFVFAGALVLSVCASLRPGPAALAGPEESPYLNTRPGVAYVGVAVCAECHREQHETYRQTPHSRALRPVDPKREPWPGSLQHEKSGLDYEMHVQEGRLRVRQSVRLASGEVSVLGDRPVDLVVGSGESSLTYLSRDGDFLLESPTTWFTRHKAWAMSPGYDMPHHAGFSRVISQQCLDCHAGRIEAREGNDFKLALHEEAIGCERCHGPGGAHVAFHREHKLAAGAKDRTIVVPTDLGRALSDDVCGQCHLDDTMVVKRPGVDLGDWRPGLPAERFRIPYGLETPSGLMRVVGHMDQMKSSRCYVQSGTMTCVTCHDPHGRPAPEARSAHYRQRCLSCHKEEACGMEGAHRRAQHADDSCIACHMPTVGTDIVHFAFTHHRVGLHKTQVEAETSLPEVVDLEAKTDVSGLAAGERERNLGLAYWQFRRRPTGDPSAPFLPLPTLFDTVRKARHHLQAAYDVGQRDARLIVALAELASLPPPPEPGQVEPPMPDFPGALRHLDDVLARTSDVPFSTRVVALHLRAGVWMRMGRFDEALPDFERLVELRREVGDWVSLAAIHRMAGRKEATLQAVRKILELRPSDPMLQMQVAQFFAEEEQPEQASLHQEIAQRLFEARQKAEAEARARAEAEDAGAAPAAPGPSK